MKYDVMFAEYREYTVTVDANSESEAQNQAKGRILAGEVLPDSHDLTFLTATETVE